MKSRCKTYLPVIEFVRMTQVELVFELRKKFEGMAFRDFYGLTAKVAVYKNLFKEESHKKRVYVRTYYQEVEKSALADMLDVTSHTCLMLKRKMDDSNKIMLSHKLNIHFM